MPFHAKGRGLVKKIDTTSKCHAQRQRSSKDGHRLGFGMLRVKRMSPIWLLASLLASCAKTQPASFSVTSHSRSFFSLHFSPPQGDSQGAVSQPHSSEHVQPPEQPNAHCPGAHTPAQRAWRQGTARRHTSNSIKSSRYFRTSSVVESVKFGIPCCFFPSCAVAGYQRAEHGRGRKRGQKAKKNSG